MDVLQGEWPDTIRSYRQIASAKARLTTVKLLERINHAALILEDLGRAAADWRLGSRAFSEQIESRIPCRASRSRAIRELTGPIRSENALAVGFVPAPVVNAAECTTEKARDDLSPAEAQALYDCIENSLIAGYSNAEGVPGLDFRNYKLVTNAPLVSSTHGGMFVNHWG
ncbi:MAG: hypothetical protein AB8B85_11080 [Paracoccaceae bacterium]